MQTTDHHVRPMPLVAGALVLLLAACGGAEGSQAAEASEPAGGGSTVQVSGLAFETSELTVTPGTPVTFINQGSVLHTVTHGTDGVPADDAAFDEQLPAGEEVTITFDEAGTFPITCTIHPAMNMTVTVEG